MERARSISKSMLSYLKRAREHKEFLIKEIKEYDRGKRHLANMMGIDANEMTQAHVDDAIKYLFPTGLFDKRARPMMKHPDLLFKAQKDAQFDEEGRPHHYLFYTGKPNYYEALSEIGNQVRALNNFEDEQLAKGIITPPDDAKYETGNREWITLEEVMDMFLERIGDAEHEYLIKSLERLSQHPYSNRCASLIDRYSKPMKGVSLDLDLPEIHRNEETGEIYTNCVTRRKEHRVCVKTVLNGTGKFDIEGKDLLFFQVPYMRRALYEPLVLSNMQDKVDVFARVQEPKPKVTGYAAIAKSVQLAVAQSIAAYVDPEIRERLRLAGLLTPDKRLTERKKFGQKKARAKYTWKRR